MKKNNWFFVALGIIVLAYLAGWIVTMHAPLIMSSNGDSIEYASLAQSLLHGHFALTGEAHEQFRTPGYPVFVAGILLVTHTYYAVTFTQILITCATAGLLFLIAKRFVGGDESHMRFVPHSAVLIFLLNPVVFGLTLQVMSDLLFTFILVLTWYLVLSGIRRPWLTVFLGAILFALATYVRPAGLVALPIFLAPFILIPATNQRKVMYAIVFSVIGVAMLLPWMIRNYAESGVFSFSSLASYNLAAYNVPLFEAERNNDSLEDERAVIARTTNIPFSNWRDLSSASSLRKYSEHVLISNGEAYGIYHVDESIGFFINPGTPIAISLLDHSLRIPVPDMDSLDIKALMRTHEYSSAIAALFSPWWIVLERVFLVLGIGFIALAIWCNRRKAYVYACVFIPLYLALLSGPVVQARYRLPAEPFTALLIAMGIVISIEWSRKNIVKLSSGSVVQ